MKRFIGKNFRILVFIAVLLITGAVLFPFFSHEKERDSEKKEHIQKGLLVSFTKTSPESFASQITVYGQAVPDKEAKLRSLVSGEIVFVSDRLEKGRIVQKGELLAKIDDIIYQSKLAQAELALSNSRLNLLREEQESDQARLSWDRSGLAGLPQSPLVLRTPQLNTAKKEVAAQMAAVKAVQREIEYCDIRSPFGGLITDRAINMGESISTGEPIATLHSIDKVEIELALDEKQWALLDGKIENTRVELFDDVRQVSWGAKITREGKRIIPQSRLRQIFCEVKKPLSQTPPLLSGTFLTARLSGRKISNLLKLPESCVTQKGFVWYMESDNTLNSFRAKPAFYKTGYVFLQVPSGISFPLHVALYPNSAFVTGLEVNPKYKPLEG